MNFLKKYLSTSLDINLTSNVSNVKKDIYVKDEHDVSLKDDVLNEELIITLKNIKEFRRPAPQSRCHRSCRLTSLKDFYSPWPEIML